MEKLWLAWFACLTSSHLNGSLELLVLLLKLLRILERSWNAETSAQHALGAVDPTDDLKQMNVKVGGAFLAICIHWRLNFRWIPWQVL